MTRRSLFRLTGLALLGRALGLDTELLESGREAEAQVAMLEGIAHG